MNKQENKEEGRFKTVRWMMNTLSNIISYPWKEEEYDMDHPTSFSPPRFYYNDTSAVDFLNEKGYVVFRNMADKEEIEKAISLWWDLAEANSNLKRNEPATWHEWIADPSVGIMSGHGIGQSQFMWFVRTLPNLRKAFEMVWGEEDLLVSFDGCGVFRPPEYNAKWKTYGGWYHADQNCFKKPGRHSIQGLLNLYPSGPEDGGIVVVPSSPPMVEAAFQKYKELSMGGDFVRFRHEFDYWKDPLKAISLRTSQNMYDLLPVKIVLEPGDFIMWDSRTIHCNHPPSKLNHDDPSSSLRLKRLVAYVCMTPAKSAQNIEELSKYRVLAFQQGITTTHWPHELRPSWLGGDKAKGAGAEYVRLTKEQATLITGKVYPHDVYDISLTAGLDIHSFLQQQREPK